MRIILNEQECCNQRYEFQNVPIVCTRAFLDTFGDQHPIIIFLALEMLEEKYPLKNWDYLQTFSVDGRTFWIISNALQGRHDTGEHITFLLPSDY